MFNFLHTFNPEPVLLSLGGLRIYWYGLFIVIGILTALTISLKLAKKFNIPQNKLFDLGFWVIIFGIIGARIYHVFLEFGYYLTNPLDVFKIWQGGIAIHGALIAGILTLYFFSKKDKVNDEVREGGLGQKINFWLATAIVLPGLALAQAIGRFGNYFNQELFGKPTNLPWGIPIGLMNRPNEYISSEFFHPTFLYESLGNLLIFGILLFILFKIAKKKDNYEIVLISYAILYSTLRFSLEFIRIDKTPIILGLRLPQIASLIIITISIIFIIYRLKKKRNIPVIARSEATKQSR